MRGLWICVLACAIGSAQSRYYLPAVADGAIVDLTNTGPTDATVTAGRAQLTLKAGATTRAKAAAEIVASAPLLVSAAATTADGRDTITSDAPLSRSLVVPIDTTAERNAGVALLNPGDVAVPVTYRLADASGTAVGQQTETLPPHARTTRYVLGDLFPSVSAGLQGTLSVDAPAPLAAVALRQTGGAAPALSPSKRRLSASLRQRLLDDITFAPSTASATKLRHYVPRIADGAIGGFTLQTSIAIYNLSGKEAHAVLACTHENGAPWTLTLPAAFTIPAGAARFVHTDGSGAPGFGAALLKSDVPVGVAAFVTASDAQGAVVWETSVSGPPPFPLQSIPVDVTEQSDAAATLYNPGRFPATPTITVFDSDGKTVTTSTLPPVAPGAQTTLSLSQLFHLAPGFTGRAAISTVGSRDGASVSVLALRQDPASPRFAALPAALQPLTPRVLNISTKLDDGRSAKANIGPAGGAVTATAADGTKYTLAVPPHALLSAEAITITPVASASGFPGAFSLSAGVQFAPEGLAFLQPARLTIEPPSAVKGLVPVAWTGAGQDAQLAAIGLDPSSIVISVPHFSGYGYGGGGSGGSGSDGGLTQGQVDALSQFYGNEQDYYEQAIKEITSAERASREAGNPPSDAWMAPVQELLEEYYTAVIEPLTQAAIASGDPTLLACAFSHGFSWQRMMSGLSDAPSVSGDLPHQQDLTAGLERLVLKYKDQCERHDPKAGYQLLGLDRLLSALGSSLYRQIEDEIIAEVPRCVPTFELDFDSEITAGSDVNAFTSAVKSTVDIVMKTSQDPDKLNELSGGGSADLKVTKLQFPFDASKFPPPCTFKQTMDGSTLTVYQTFNGADTAIYYDANISAADNQNPVLRADGTPAFCQPQSDPTANPTYMTVVLSTGATGDGLQAGCGFDVVNINHLWSTAFTGAHQDEIIGGGANGPVIAITGWKFPGGTGDVYATKTYSRTVTAGGNLKETTTLVLKHVAANQ